MRGLVVVESGDEPIHEKDVPAVVSLFRALLLPCHGALLELVSHASHPSSLPSFSLSPFLSLSSFFSPSLLSFMEKTIQNPSSCGSILESVIDLRFGVIGGIENLFFFKFSYYILILYDYYIKIVLNNSKIECKAHMKL